MRFATIEELTPYVTYHRQLMIDVTIGLKHVEVHEDNEGAFALFLVREEVEDSRERSIEATAGMMEFTTLETSERVRARVKVKQLDR